MLRTVHHAVTIAAFTGEREGYVLRSACDAVDAVCGTLVRLSGAAERRRPTVLHAHDIVGIEQWQSGIIARVVTKPDRIRKHGPTCLEVYDEQQRHRAVIQFGPDDAEADGHDGHATHAMSPSHVIGVTHRLTRRNWVDALCLYRCPDDKAFTAHDRQLIAMFWEECAWLCSPGPQHDGASVGGNDTRSGKPLPPRLRQVLEALLAGHATHRIAADLCISTHTVRDHIKRLYAELGVCSREELVARCLTFSHDGIHAKHQNGH
ncbi:MAG: hypothetical protein GC159_05040 [Phycisphaera sp.]|nr:hypothetical protein [Phycisphaera sp.]